MFCYEMGIVVCEGWCFVWLGDAMGGTQNVALEQTTSAVGGAAVLHK